MAAKKNTTERFFEKIERIPFCGCWIWTGTIIGKTAKYGAFNIGRGNVSTHRFSWELHNAVEIPDGMCVLHRCDIPCCVNPEHLFLGTHADNMHDMKRKGRARGAPGEENSHAKLTNSDVAYIRHQHNLGVSGLSLANEFGVAHSTIYRITHGLGWAE